MQSTQGAFRKAILKVGKYHSPDGEVEVTPSRLFHWSRQVARLQANNYAIPMHWDHAATEEHLQPISMDAIDDERRRSAARTVGKLERFEVAPDGQSAEITVRTLTPSATEAVGSNAVFVSPVIFPQWKDGSGQTYADVITSIDLVDHPVDNSQGQFIEATPTALSCCIRMGLGSTAFREGESMGSMQRMGSNDPADGFYTTPGGVVRPITVGGEGYLDEGHKSANPSKKFKKRNGRRKKKKMGLAGPQRMKVDPDEQDELPEDSPFSDNSPSGGMPDDAEDNTGYDEDAVVDGGDDDQLDEVLILLQDFGITLPEDTTDENLLERLKVSLTAMCKSKEDEGDDMAQDQTNQVGSGSVTQAEPSMMTMSLQARSALAYAEKQHKQSVSDKLEALLKNGRCTPAEFDAQVQRLPKVKLSLNSQGEPTPSQLELWIESRSACPRGTFWSDEQKLKRMSVRQVDPPDSWNDHNSLSKKQEDEAVNRLLRR